MASPKVLKKVDEKYILSIFHTLIIIQSATFLSLNFVKSLANAKIIGTAKFCMNKHYYQKENFSCILTSFHFFKIKYYNF